MYNKYCSVYMMSNHQLGLNISHRRLYFSAYIQVDAQFEHILYFYKITSNSIMTRVRNTYLATVSRRFLIICRLTYRSIY